MGYDIGPEPNWSALGPKVYEVTIMRDVTFADKVLIRWEGTPEELEEKGADYVDEHAFRTTTQDLVECFDTRVFAVDPYDEEDQQ